MTKTFFSPLRVAIASCAVAAAVAGTAFGVAVPRPANAAESTSPSQSCSWGSDSTGGFSIGTDSSHYLLGHSVLPSQAPVRVATIPGSDPSNLDNWGWHSATSTATASDDGTELIGADYNAITGSVFDDESFHFTRVVTDVTGDEALAVGTDGVSLDSLWTSTDDDSTGGIADARAATTNPIYAGDSGAISTDGHTVAWGNSARPGHVAYSADAIAFPTNNDSGTLGDVEEIALPDASDVPLSESISGGSLTVVVREADGTVSALTSPNPDAGTHATVGGITEVSGGSWSSAPASAPSGASTSDVAPSALPDQLTWDASQPAEGQTWHDSTGGSFPGNGVRLTADIGKNSISGTGITDLSISGDSDVYYVVGADAHVYAYKAQRDVAIARANCTAAPAPQTEKPSPKPQAPQVLPPETKAPAPKPQVQAPAPQPKVSIPVISG